MIIDQWQVDRLRTDAAAVYPDGCRDVIWFRLPGQAPRWKLSDLDLTRRTVSGAAGGEMCGYRLAPGTQIDADALLAGLAAERPDEAEAVIADHIRLPGDTAEILQSFRAAPELRITAQARRLGVAPRSLQRQCSIRTGQPPLYWLRLMRLRRALAEAAQGAPLAEVAADAGFADQAHFTREARAFHGAPPGRLLADPLAMSLILAPGL